MTAPAGVPGRGRRRALLQGTNPLALVWVGLAALAGSFAVRDLPSAVAAASAWAVAGLLLLPSWRYPLACLALCGVSAGLVAYSAWRLGNPDHAPVAALRILVLAWPGAVVVAFVDPSDLGDELAQRLRVPGRPVAAFVASLQRVGGLGATLQQVHRARRVRGVGPSGPVSAVRHAGSVTFAMLASALRDAGRTSIAMDARGFATATRRTWAQQVPWTWRDTAVVAGAAVLGFVPVLSRLLT